MCAWSPGSGGWVAPPPRLQALLGEAPRRVGGPVSSPEEAQADRLPRRRPRPFRVRVVHWRPKVWMQSRQVDDAIAPLARVRVGLCPAGQNKPYGQHYPHVGYHLPQTDIMVYPYMPSVCLFPLGVWQACPFFRQTKACSHGLVAPFRHLGRAAQARQPTSLCVCRGDFGLALRSPSCDQPSAVTAGTVFPGIWACHPILWAAATTCMAQIPTALLLALRPSQGSTPHIPTHNQPHLGDSASMLSGLNVTGVSSYQ